MSQATHKILDPTVCPQKQYQQSLECYKMIIFCFYINVNHKIPWWLKSLYQDLQYVHSVESTIHHTWSFFFKYVLESLWLSCRDMRSVSMSSKSPRTYTQPHHNRSCHKLAHNDLNSANYKTRSLQVNHALAYPFIKSIFSCNGNQILLLIEFSSNTVFKFHDENQHIQVEHQCSRTPLNNEAHLHKKLSKSIMRFVCIVCRMRLKPHQYIDLGFL